MRRLMFLLQKEFIQLVRNPIMPRMIVIMPLMTILWMPWAATMDIRNLNVAVVDNDCTPLSSRLVEKLSASNYFDLSGYFLSYTEALQSVERGQTDVIVELPLHFARDIENNSSAVVFVSPNAVNGAQGSLSGQYITSMILDFASELSSERWPALRSAMRVEQRYLFNPTLDSKWFMIPALMVMLLSMLCGFLPTLNIVSEKEKGTIEQINVSPVSRVEFMVAKIVPIWIVGYIVMTISIFATYWLYGLWPLGSLWTIYGASLLFAAVFAGGGLVVSSVSSTLQQAMFVMFFFFIVFMLTCGLFTPIKSMPDLVQHLTMINPMRYIGDIMRAVYLKGSVASELWFEFVVLAGFAVVFNLWAIVVYKKQA